MCAAYVINSILMHTVSSWTNQIPHIRTCPLYAILYNVCRVCVSDMWYMHQTMCANGVQVLKKKVWLLAWEECLAILLKSFSLTLSPSLKTLLLSLPAFVCKSVFSVMGHVNYMICCELSHDWLAMSHDCFLTQEPEPDFIRRWSGAIT